MRIKILVFLAMTLVMMSCLGLNVFAENSTTATVPVTLTVENQYRAVNVTIPASLPVYVINGTVVTADNACITNNSTSGSVQVTGVSVTDGAYRVGSYDNFAGSKTIALKINDCVTKMAGKMSITETAFPKIHAGDSLPLTYFAKVSADAPNADNVNAAKIAANRPHARSKSATLPER